MTNKNENAHLAMGGLGNIIEAAKRRTSPRIIAPLKNYNKTKATGFGASSEEWQHFDMVLGLTADLLPCVADPAAPISAQSGLTSLGKVPSRYTTQRKVVGFPQWTQHRSTNEEVDKWMREPNYGICIQTRYVRAIDVDVDDPELAQAIRAYIADRFSLPERFRNDSFKFLLAFHLGGDFGKRKFSTAHGIVEFLASGQQFVAAGTHQKGARIQWRGGLPNEIPTLSEDEFNELWAGLSEEFGIEPATESSATTRHQKLADAVASDPVARFLSEKRLIKRAERDGRLHMDCPWQNEHTTDTGDSSTTYFPPNTGGYAEGAFNCLHAHCENRKLADMLLAVGFAPADEFDVIVQEVDAAPPNDKPKLKFQGELVEDFCNKPDPAWLIKNVLPEAELAYVYGESGSGKSFFILDMCAALVRGTLWRDRKTKRCRVAYVCAEGAGGFRKRLKAYACANNIPLSGIPMAVFSMPPNLREKSDAVELARGIVAMGGANIVVFDTLAQCMPGANENSGEDMGLILSNCKGISRALGGAMAVLIHHSGKDSSKGLRGWSGGHAAADCVIEVLRNENERCAIITKQKDGEDGAEFGFRLLEVVLSLDSDGEEVTSCVMEHGEGGRPTKMRGVKGVVEKLVLSTLPNIISVDAPTVSLHDLKDHIKKEMVFDPNDGKRDTRDQRIYRAVESLKTSGRITVEGMNIGLADR